MAVNIRAESISLRDAATHSSTRELTKTAPQGDNDNNIDDDIKMASDYHPIDCLPPLAASIIRTHFAIPCPHQFDPGRE